MWNKKQSILLSRLCVYIFMAIVVVAMATGYYIIEWFIMRSGSIQEGANIFFMITAYTCSVFVLLILFNLNTILKNISHDKVFIRENTDAIKISSWSCIAIGCICLISVLYYVPFALVSIASAFMGLLLRIIKNVIEKAIEIKEEHEYTI